MVRLAITLRLGFAIAALYSAGVTYAEDKYALVDLGNNITPVAMNDLGQVVGTYSASTFTGTHAFITGKNGAGLRDLGTLGGPTSTRIAVNNAGTVVGLSDIVSPNSSGTLIDAFIYTPATGMADLSVATGGNITYPTSINNIGQIAGYGDQDIFVTGANGLGGVAYPTRYSPGSGPFVNDEGQIESWGVNPSFGVTNPDGTFVDFYGAVLSELQALSAAEIYTGFSSPIDISFNNPGKVLAVIPTSYRTVVGTPILTANLTLVGSSSTGKTKFLNSPIDPATKPQTVTCWGYSINDHNVIVGGGLGPVHSTPAAKQNFTPANGSNALASSSAFIYHDEKFTDLNTKVVMPAGVYLNFAISVNNVGDILSWGSDGHVYLLLAEPNM